MIYLGSLISGGINGLFASGAGQVIVFLLIYVLKIETHTARATSVFCISIVTVVTLIRYMSFVKLDLTNCIIVSIFGLIFGYAGSKIMKKIPAAYLNLTSGIIIAGFALYNLIRG